MNTYEISIAKALREANWKAIKHPRMEYRITDRAGIIRVTEWPQGSNSYIEGDSYLYTCCYGPEGVSGNPNHEQHAFIESIPDILREIASKQPKLWYAVMKDADDTDWGYGSYDKGEAMEMVQQYIPDGGYIAVIDESGSEPMCVREIREF